jgi:hypothetical protein
MKTTTLLYFISVLIFTLSCRPKEEVIIPVKENIEVKNPSKINYLKTIKVEGASEVVVDDSLGTIQVKLPADYSSTSISVSLVLHSNAYLRQVNGFTGTQFKPDSSTQSTFKVRYAGDFPIEFVTQILSGFSNKSYKIYVEHLGRPMAKIVYSDYYVSNYFSANFRLDSLLGIGTIPSNPENSIKYLGLLRKTNAVNSDTCILSVGVYAYLPLKLEKYIPFENQLFTFEIVKGNQRTIIKEDISFNRQKTFSYGGRYRTSNSKTFMIYGFGGYFSFSDRYIIKLSNEFSPTIFEVEAEVDKTNYKNLIIKFPSSFPKGSYLFDLYENGKKISDKGMVSVSENASEKSILKLWRKRGTYSEYYDYFIEPTEIEKKSFSRGDTLSLMPLPTIIYSSTLQKENIPELKLTNNNRIIVLQPIPVRVSWTVALTSFHGFYYVLPKDLESGLYEGLLLYHNGEESLRYWNKIEIN